MNTRLSPDVSELLGRIEEFDLMTDTDLDVLRLAARYGDAEAIRTEGDKWSGRIALEIFALADVVGGKS